MQKPPKKFETPFNLEAEIAVLGCILMDGNETLKRIGHIITKEDFFEEKHSIVFEHAKKLYDSGVEPDMLTLHDSLKSSGWIEAIGGAVWLSELSSQAPIVNSAVSYARIV